MKPEHTDKRILYASVWISIFAIAFAWVESAVVVYLRDIFFDGTFLFPIKTVWKAGERILNDLVPIEIGREIATIIMLVASGCLAGKNTIQRFSFFLISFGVWDIFYYIWLRVMTRWPESLLTWDLIFYVPLPWVGPVITPVMIALEMIAIGFFLLYYQIKGHTIRFRWYDLIVEASCALLMIIAFCWDWKNILRIPDGIARDGIPSEFAWWLFLPAYITSALYLAIRIRNQVYSKDNKIV